MTFESNVFIFMTVLPPVLVPRNPQQITGPRYEPTRYANNQGQTQVYSPQSESSPLTFDYPGMSRFVCIYYLTTSVLQDVITDLHVLWI